MSKRRTRASSSLSALFDAATDAMEVTRSRASGAQAADAPQLLPVDDIRPDPFQARRVLPPAIRAGFVAGQLDPPAALLAWRALAEQDPEEARLLEAQVVSLAHSVRRQKLVNPITVYADDQGGYVLETGERRWWAHWWLTSVEGEPTYTHIRAQVVEEPSPERQAAENLQDSPLSAVQEACQIARLLLHLAGRDDDHVVAISAAHEMGGAVDPSVWLGYGPFRAALDLQRSDIYGKWPIVSQVMGRGQRQLQRQLDILCLTDSALALADRAGLTEGQLRKVVELADEMDDDRQRRIIAIIAKYNLPGAEVATLAKRKDLAAAEERYALRHAKVDSARTAPTVRRPATVMVDRLRKVGRAVQRREKQGRPMRDQVDEVVSEIMASGQPEVIHQELSELTALLAQVRDRLRISMGAQ